MIKRFFVKSSLPLALSGLFLLSACGGGGGGDTVSTTSGTAEGLWTGATNSNRNATGLVLSDGTTYILYTQVSGVNIAGAVYGKGASNGGAFVGNMKDFSLEGVLSPSPANVSLSATYTAKSSLTGSVKYTSSNAVGQNVGFSFSYDAAYDSASLLSDITGTFSGNAVHSGGMVPVSLTINADGTLSGASLACTFTGTATANTKNYFNLSITFGATGCQFPSQTLHGVFYYNKTTRRLYAMAPNGDETDGFITVLTR